MSSDLSNQRGIDPEIILAAISALKERGWDINPYTVADEARIPRSTLYRSSELMDMVALARKPAAYPAQGSISRDNLKNIAGLEADIARLEKEVAELKQLNDHLAAGQEQAWQAGYQAALEGPERKSRQPHTACESDIDKPAANEQLVPVDLPIDLYVQEQPDVLAEMPETELQGLLAKEPDISDFACSQTDFYEKQANPNDQGVHIDQAISAAAIPASADEHLANTIGFTADELRDLVKHRIGQPVDETIAEKREDVGDKKHAGSRFVGAHRAHQDPPQTSFVLRTVPPDIRKSCLVLGLRPEDLTFDAVHKAWKKEMTREHPDQGGDTEMAVYLNTAKDILFRWLEAQRPKLGKTFGTSTMQFHKGLDISMPEPEAHGESD